MEHRSWRGTADSAREFPQKSGVATGIGKTSELRLPQASKIR
jgi:hypothetical protein